MPPNHKPWWKADADADESDKLALLPSDAARWAWFRMMCRAKTQRRMGVFSGRVHLKALLGLNGRFVPDLIRIGTAHEWPTTCSRCQVDYTEDAQPGDVVVHDYRREQRDPTAAERQARARDRRSHGHTERDGDSHGSVTSSSRALSPSLSTSRSLPGEDEPYQVGGGPIEPYRTMEELTGFPVQRVSDRTIQRLDGLCDRRHVDPVVAAMRIVAPGIAPQPPSPDQLVYEVIKHLEPFSNGRTAKVVAAKGEVSAEEAQSAFRS